MGVNLKLLYFYWEVGSLIIQRLQQANWGDKLFDVLATDLNKSSPGTEGFSKTNLKNMRAFATHYPSMELRQGFALYGTNYPTHVSSKRFEIDLLMYNTKLHCYFVIELKRGDFKPPDGQLNFYLSAVDEQLKMPEDGPTIGLILCEKKDKVIAEYALRRVESPMGIAEYELAKVIAISFS